MTKDANPQTFFTGMKKMFQNSFGFWTLHDTHESKENHQKRLTRTNSVYLTSRMRLFSSKKNFIFPFQKFGDNLFSNRVCSLLLSKTVYQGREEYEKTDLVEGKKKTLKILVQSKKIEGKKEIYLLVFNPQMKSWHMMYKIAHFAHLQNLCRE